MTIPMDKIESVSVDKAAVVVNTDQDVIRGQVRLAPTGDWRVVEGGKERTVKAASVQAVMTAESYHQQFEENRRLWNGWKGAANFGYSIQSGDQRTRSFSSVVTATKEGAFNLIFRPHWRMNWDLTTLLSHAEQHDTSVRSNTVSTNLREDYLLSRRDFLFVAGGMDHIDAQGLYFVAEDGRGVRARPDHGRANVAENSGGRELHSRKVRHWHHEKERGGVFRRELRLADGASNPS